MTDEHTSDELDPSVATDGAETGDHEVTQADAPSLPDAPSADEAAEDTGSGRNLVLIGLVALAVVLAVIAGLLLAAGLDLKSERDDRRAAASVAGEFAAATLSYDHRDLEGSVDAVLELSTAEYAEQYQTAFFEELQPVVDELRARGRVHVRDVYISEISDDNATAVVSFDAVIRSTIGTRRLSGSYVRIDLVKEGGNWKADQLTFLATTQEGLDPVGGTSADGTGATTETTAPAG